jgi:hypothetical protein
VRDPVLNLWVRAAKPDGKPPISRIGHATAN